MSTMKLLRLLALFGSFLKTVNAATVLVDAKFGSGTDHFRFHKDTFGTNKPHYVSGSRFSAGDGSLGIWLGGKDDHEIWDMSGGWKRSIHLNRPVRNLWIVFHYQVVLSKELDHGEFVKVLAKFGNRFLGKDGVVKVVEADNGNVAQNTGFVRFQADLGYLPRGDYELLLGAFLNSKNDKNEKADIYFDNVVVKADFMPQYWTRTFDFSKGKDGFWPQSNNHKYSKLEAKNKALGVWLGGGDNHRITTMRGWWGRWVNIPHHSKFIEISFTYTVYLSPAMKKGQKVSITSEFYGKDVCSTHVYEAKDDNEQQKFGPDTVTVRVTSKKAGWNIFRLKSELNYKDNMHQKADIYFTHVSFRYIFW